MSEEEIGKIRIENGVVYVDYTDVVHGRPDKVILTIKLSKNVADELFIKLKEELSKKPDNSEMLKHEKEKIRERLDRLEKSIEYDGK